jgi:dolichol-phosphate mannosyltransferase
MTSVAVVIPTLNEAGSIGPLLTRLAKALEGMDASVMIVDDGSDDLPLIVAGLAPTLNVGVRVVRRASPVGRLGGAVLEGMRQTSSDIVVVCDGDLQHPPELIPELVRQIEGHDIVVASRYIGGGSAAGLSGRLRHGVSRASVALSKLIFPRRLHGCSDPMSGFFALRRESVTTQGLRPQGYKILLEIIARSKPLRITELPFTFGERLAGESHANMSEGLRFVRQLARLRTASSSKALLFMLVGMSGVLPNLALIFLLTQAGMGYLLASILGVQLGVAWNFAGAELLVWKDHRHGRLLHRFGAFVLVGETDLARIPFVFVIVDVIGLNHSVLAALITMAAAFLLRFSLADKLVYRRTTADRSQTEQADQTDRAEGVRSQPAPLRATG